MSDEPSGAQASDGSEPSADMKGKMREECEAKIKHLMEKHQDKVEEIKTEHEDEMKSLRESFERDFKNKEDMKKKIEDLGSKDLPKEDLMAELMKLIKEFPKNTDFCDKLESMLEKAGVKVEDVVKAAEEACGIESPDFDWVLPLIIMIAACGCVAIISPFQFLVQAIGVVIAIVGNFLVDEVESGLATVSADKLK
ncbi:uncharacterized protein LOC120325431 [Styela clava]